MVKSKALRMSDIKPVGNSKRKTGVQSFSDFQGEASHKRFDQMIDETIYIVKIQVMTSESFGLGYKLHFKDMPNAQATYTAAVFGQFPVEQLDNLYHLTNSGERISLDSPVKVTIRAAGKSYKFE